MKERKKTTGDGRTQKDYQTSVKLRSRCPVVSLHSFISGSLHAFFHLCLVSILFQLHRSLNEMMFKRQCFPWYMYSVCCLLGCYSVIVQIILKCHTLKYMQEDPSKQQNLGGSQGCPHQRGFVVQKLLNTNHHHVLIIHLRLFEQPLEWFSS